MTIEPKAQQDTDSGYERIPDLRNRTLIETVLSQESSTSDFFAIHAASRESHLQTQNLSGQKKGVTGPVR